MNPACTTYIICTVVRLLSTYGHIIPVRGGIGGEGTCYCPCAREGPTALVAMSIDAIG